MPNWLWIETSVSLQTVSKKSCWIYFTLVADSFRNESFRFRKDVVFPSSQVKLASKCFALLSLGLRNLSLVRKLNPLEWLESNAIISVKALLPFPLLPIIVISPWLNGMETLSNQASLRLDLSIFWIILMNYKISIILKHYVISVILQ